MRALTILPTAIGGAANNRMSDIALGMGATLSFRCLLPKETTVRNGSGPVVGERRVWSRENPRATASARAKADLTAASHLESG
jgi:hypothetical protein